MIDQVLLDAAIARQFMNCIANAESSFSVRMALPGMTDMHVRTRAIAEVLYTVSRPMHASPKKSPCPRVPRAAPFPRLDTSASFTSPLST